MHVMRALPCRRVHWGLLTTFCTALTHEGSTFVNANSMGKCERRWCWAWLGVCAILLGRKSVVSIKYVWPCSLIGGAFRFLRGCMSSSPCPSWPISSYDRWVCRQWGTACRQLFANCDQINWSSGHEPKNANNKDKNRQACVINMEARYGCKRGCKHHNRHVDRQYGDWIPGTESVASRPANGHQQFLMKAFPFDCIQRYYLSKI